MIFMHDLCICNVNVNLNNPIEFTTTKLSIFDLDFLVCYTLEVGDCQGRELPLVQDVQAGAAVHQADQAEVPAVSCGVVQTGVA
jgi:hypothetical protein